MRIANNEYLGPVILFWETSGQLAPNYEVLANAKTFLKETDSNSTTTLPIYFGIACEDSNMRLW